MFLITSAAYITPGLISEFGRIPPAMLPVQNKRLYEHQMALAHSKERIVLSLPASYTLPQFDKKKLLDRNVEIVYVPDDFSLGQSVVYVLNVVGKYGEPLRILHGDTLFSNCPDTVDVCAISNPEDNYNWSHAEGQYKKNIYAGYFSFSNQSMLIKEITEHLYNFMDGIESYNSKMGVVLQELPNWMDFGIVNTYYKSISKLTTQRVFNSMVVSRYSVRKSSYDKKKMRAEANWLSSLPTSMKHYAPALWDAGEDGGKGYYEIEYYYLPSLASMYVFGKNKPYVWEEIIDACINFFNEEIQYAPENKAHYAALNDLLYTSKTLKRLEEYSKQSGVSLQEPWTINGVNTPPLLNIVDEMDELISKHDNRFVSMMHGDPCFSNILYDFKSKSIKVIDPRGVDVEGNLSIYGDFRYDVAKLAHSIIGMYDFIIGGMFKYKENSLYNVALSFEPDSERDQIQEYFKLQKFGGYSLKDLSTYPILVHLFLSMLPLHSDNKERQNALLANALRIYIELKNQLL